LERIGGEAHQGYSAARRRSLIAMVGGRALRKMNGTASLILVKPLVVMAARVLGPGPTRLRLIKLAHNLEPRGVAVEPERRLVERPQPVVQPSKRAA
jgi:hypothetical protein